MTDQPEPFVIDDDQAEAVWFLGTLATIKANGAQTGESFCLVEFTHPKGFATPLHVHHTQDEAFYVLSGAMRVVCGDQVWRATTGAFMWLPRDVPHGYAVDGDETLRTLAMTLPAGFERFVRATASPATTRALPPPAAPDIAKLDAEGAKVGIELLAPPDVVLEKTGLSTRATMN